MTYYRASVAKIRQDYHQYLCELVDGEEAYNLLLNDMDKVPFQPLIERDENRVQDGIVLRERYLEDAQWSNGEEALDGECSVLEMMIALAERMAFETSNDDVDDKIQMKRYFWEMVRNLGLLNCTDERYVELYGYLLVPQTISSFVSRNIEFNGEGGLFPLKSPPSDQRKQEIWYQMQLYLKENYAV